MDYQRAEVVSIRLEHTTPGRNSIKVFDHLERELNVTKIQLTIDTQADLYELTFMDNGQQRHATLVNVDTTDD